MAALILSGLALVFVGAAMWCLRQMREVLVEHRGTLMGGGGAAFGCFFGFVASAIALGNVLRRLLQVLS